MEEQAPLQLGGNIELSGFNEFDGATMIVVKKIVGTFARKFSDNINGFEGLKVNLLNADGQFELSGRIIVSGNEQTKQAQGNNLFYALDNVLKGLDTTNQ